MTGASKQDTAVRAGNLKALSQNAPDLHARISGHRPRSKLVIGSGGGSDVVVAGKSTYPAGARRFSEEQVDRFIERPFHLVLPEPDAGGNDRYSNAFTGKVLDRARKAEIGFLPKPASPQSYFLFVFGIGLGEHIDRLVDSFDSRHVVFLEPDFDFFFHSLETYDWATLMTKLAKKEGRVHFIFGDDPELSARTLREYIMDTNYLGIDGTTCFTHLNADFANRTLQVFAPEAALYFRGLGFFYDETLMLRNAYGNLRAGTPKIYRRPRGSIDDVPAFVVTSGPSLDDAIDYLKENQGKAVIISAGTTLRPLLVNGIVPDFHIEMENLNVFVDAVELANEFDLSSICLVAASTVDQHISGLYEKTLYFFRPYNCPFRLFCDSDTTCLKFPDPGVVNAAYSFALEVGFQEIYLFGADLGTRGTGRHHSKDHYLYSEVALDAFDDIRTYVIPVEANFGGEFLTSRDFLVTMKKIEESISAFGKGRHLYNCSDGVRIRGTEPLRADAIRPLDPAERKAALVESLFESFPVYTKDQMETAWDLDRILAACEDLVDQLREILDSHPSLRDNSYQPRLLRLFHSIYMTQIEKASKIDQTVRIMFQGTVCYLLMVGEYYLLRAATPEMADKFETIVREELTASLEKLRADALDILKNPTKVPPPMSRDSPVSHEVIAEDTHTWGMVRRNDPCPCGSGRRYKNCHGKAV